MYQSRFHQAISAESRQAIETWGAAVDEAVSRRTDELTGIRRYLHTHPEPSGEETATSEFIRQRLEQAGISSRRCAGGIGVIAELAVGHPQADSPLIAVRADIDGLRMPDEKQVSYCSQNPGVAHACGHDAHTATLLGVALTAADLNGGAPLENVVSVPGLRLRLIFQPAEETSTGAAEMVEQGAVAGASSILALHVDPQRACGEVGIRYGMLTAHCDEIDMAVTGGGGHAARPHHAIDPIAAAAHLITAIYEYLPRSVDSRDPSVVTIGHIAGGSAPNVIPDRVDLHGTLRTIDGGARQTLKNRIREICGGVEQSSGTRIQVEFHKPLEGVNNDRRVAAALEEASRQVVGRQGVAHIDRPSMGGEDFSVYLTQVPGAMLRLGCASDGKEAPFLHSPLFDIDERAIALGTRILFRAALLLAVTSPDSMTD